MEPRAATLPTQEIVVVEPTPSEPGPVEGLAAVLKRTWLRELVSDDDALDEALRLDMVERLAIIGEPWSLELLARAAQEDDAAAVRDAAQAAISGRAPR